MPAYLCAFSAGDLWHTVRLWDLEHGRCLQSISVDGGFLGHKCKKNLLKKVVFIGFLMFFICFCSFVGVCCTLLVQGLLEGDGILVSFWMLLFQILEGTRKILRVST